MAQKDGEASVEDILRSIKQVISREDGPRRSADTFARDAARQLGEPVPERAASFSPYSFQRHSPFGARHPDSSPSADELSDDPADAGADEGRTDVFDLRSLGSGAFVDDDPEGDFAAAPAGPETSPNGLTTPAAERSPPDIGDEEDAPVPVVDDTECALGAGDAGAGTGDAADDGVNIPSLHAGQAVTPALGEADADASMSASPVSEGLIADAAADALRNRFSALQAAATAPNSAASPAGTAPNPLEDIVREMLRPMLKQWLDDNMPGLVEKIVEREIARITGRL